MRELPGFYFDEEKNRYFPISSIKSRPAVPSTTSNTQETHDYRPLKPQNRKHTFHDSLLEQKHSINRISRSIAAHNITSAQLVRASLTRTSGRGDPDSNVPFTSFCIYGTPDQELTLALGDQKGYCFTARNDELHPDFIMTSQVTSISSANGITLYTSFGPKPTILIRNVESPDALHILRPEKLQDVRTSEFNGKSLVLGMRKQAVHFPDINVPEVSNPMYVGSDVFALCQENFSLWTGARNGTVHVFDTRISQKMEVLHNRFSADQQRTSITHIRRVHEFELLISTLDGRAELYDTRFIRRSTCPDPTLSLDGHIDRNQILHNLGLTIDPFQEYLYMAGQDCRVRAWSLRTGKQIKFPPQDSPSGPLNREFSAPVLGMQTMRYKNQNILWLISGSHFEQYAMP